MSDIFGYNRTQNPNVPIASSESAIISLAGGFTLAQSVDVQYGQTIKTLSELGNPNIYFIPGPGEGSVTAEKLVGSGGFFSSFKGHQCGRVDAFSITVSGGTCMQGGGGSMSFGSGIVERVNARIVAGQQEMIEGGTIRVGNLVA